MRLKMEVHDAQAKQALQNLIAAGRDLTPAMLSIGELLLRSTRERFEDQAEPDGTPWAPLSEVTKARKARFPDKILTEYGHLRGQLNFNAGATFVEIGSSQNLREHPPIRRRQGRVRHHQARCADPLGRHSRPAVPRALRRGPGRHRSGK